MDLSIYNDINSTDIENRQDVTLTEIIDEAIEKYPESVAVYDYGRSLKYKNLGTQSDLASATIKTLVKRKECVAIIMERGCESVIASLAVLKSDCVYVPIDINYPINRIKYMLQDSNCTLIIIQRKFEKLVCELADMQDKIIYYDELSRGKKGGLKGSKSNENDIAYIMYTSGTTGRPKGVMISHKAILNTLFWMGRKFHLCRDDIISHRTSISFTDSIFEIFWPLMFGATIQIINDNDAKDMNRLYIMLENVTMMQCVPSLLKLFLNYVEREKIQNPLPKLKWIFNCGEHISAYLAKKFNRLFHSTTIANTYGMTESAIFASCYIISKNTELNQIPIGKPIDNTKMFVYDNDELCDIGQIGEIYISGIGIATGYLNMLSTEEEKFCCINGSHCYKTGDLGAIREDGNIDYYGRVDDQIKIHGYRVEIEEVEKVIMEHMNSSDIAVISDVDQFGDNYLICFYASLRFVNIAEMKKSLSSFLPDYMIPREYIYIEEIPISQHDKINKELLRQKLTKRKDKRNYLRNAISNIWNILLPEAEIDSDTDFFDIGGDSMLALRLKSMLDVIEIEIEQSKIKEHSTINSLVNLIMEGDNN